VAGRQVVFRFKKQGEERLDRFLVEQLPEFSRSRLQGLIKDGFVSVDGTPAPKSGLKLERGARVEVHIPPTVPATLQGERIPLDIIFENDDLLVINKPAGMVVHPAAGYDTGTLVQAVLGYAPDIQGIGGEQRPGIVHRLDKGTSGLILVAKNDAAHRWLQNQFRQRKVEKVYLALVDGAPPTPTGRVEAPIGRDPAHRKQMAVRPPGKGRGAVSEYKTLEHFKAHTLLEVHPLTGRTHQIRLHLAFLGCPVVGDQIYGRRHPTLEFKRHFLHAARLTIVLPGAKEASTFEAPLPRELEEVMERLRSGRLK
jgi:23S rRNA pseudouridine1911/1915/1917 synthase